MPHSRIRHGIVQVQKLLSFWPVVGILGLRQVGKTTLLKSISESFQKKRVSVSLDDDAVREEAIASSKVFLSRLGTPCIIDEVQKAPNLFDGIKLLVDKKKIPGSYLLSGSTQFSAKIGIRESLTGRMGTLQLFPFTISETLNLPLLNKKDFKIIPIHKPRFTIDKWSPFLNRGGLPVPLFTRDENQRNLYWQGWFETTLFRDLSRVYGKGYDPDLANLILNRIGTVLSEGEFPTTRVFRQSSRKIKNYLNAMGNIFLLRKIPCHLDGIGQDVWLPTDSGFAHFLMPKKIGSAAQLTLARVYLMNEILANAEYLGEKLKWIYFKSQHGHPIDFIWNGTPVKIIAHVSGSYGWEERAIFGAMKKLGSKIGILVAPIDESYRPKKGIMILPWSSWS